MEEEARLNEFCTMMDLDSKDNAAKVEAFQEVVLTLSRSYENVDAVLNVEGVAQDQAVEGYRALAQHFFRGEDPHDAMMMQRLHSKLAIPVGQARMKAQWKEWSVADRVLAVIQADERKVEEMAAAGEGKTSNSKGEEEVTVNATRKETGELAKLRTHVEWGKFAQRVQKMIEMKANKLEMVELQLKSGIPAVRRNLLGQKQYTGGTWDDLQNYRCTSASDRTLLTVVPHQCGCEAVVVYAQHMASLYSQTKSLAPM